MKLLPQGLWPVMLTPFNDRNGLDLPALEQLTEFYISAGANGLFANCLSSEMFQLTDEERLLITKTVVDTAKGRLPVIATGSFGNDMDVSATFIKRIYDTGVKAVVISTSQPCDEFESDDVFKLQMEALLEKTGDIPLGLYECPVPYKRLLLPAIIKWLAHTNRFVFHKDTSCDLTEIKRKLEAIEGTPLGFYNAHVPTGVASIISGARGLSPISANLYPELLSYLLSTLKKEGKTEKLEGLNRSLDMMDSIIHNNYPYTAKLFLKERGLKIQPNCRISRSPMQVQDIKKMETIRNVFNQLVAELGIEIVRF
ncbi:MAG: dihydrodipicolinate synthase family protein [Bacteroidia bacterium]|nr:dihydrodipicolinate synthase family protein [Bacteroidia bacterium]